MNEQLHNSLTELEDTLTEINDWSTILKETEGSAAGVIDEARESLEQARKLVNQIMASSDRSLQALQKLGTDVQSSAEEIFQMYRDLASVSAELVEYLSSVNFPARLDKLDATVAFLQQGLQNLSDKQDRHKDQLEKKMEKEGQQGKQKMHDVLMQLSSSLEKESLTYQQKIQDMQQQYELFLTKEREKLQEQIHSLSRRQQTNSWIQIGLMVLVMIGVFYAIISR